MVLTIGQRPIKPIPAEIRQHCAIYFEEKTYTQAITLLTSLLQSNTSTRPQHPAFVPGPSTLALLATILVHPSTTTRAQNPETKSACVAANAYLTCLLAQCSPSSSRLSKALIFSQSSSTTDPGIDNKHKRAWQSSRKRQRVSNGGTNGTNTPTSPTSNPTSDSEYDSSEQRIHDPLFGVASLYNRAESFWSTVGWAFVCSVRYKHRWSYWKHWLNFTLDVLDKDRELCNAVPRGAHDEQCAENRQQQASQHQTLGLHYVPSPASRTIYTHILRATLATASPQSIQEFPEIWRGETKLIKVKDKPWRRSDAVRKKLDLFEGEFGDYADEGVCDDEDDTGEVKKESMGASRPGRSRNAKRKKMPGFTDFRGVDLDREPPNEDSDGSWVSGEQVANENGLDAFGGHEALVLRQRLLAFLLRTTTSETMPRLVEALADELRALPVPVFAFFVTQFPSAHLQSTTNSGQPTHHQIPESAQTTLLLTLLRALASPSLPPYFDINTVPSLHTLAATLLPCCAGSLKAPDQARVALLLESLLRLCTQGKADLTDAPKSALFTSSRIGANARANKIHVAKEVKKGKEWARHKAVTEEAEQWVGGCEDRMRLIVAGLR